jgi:hypothetical protein
MIANQCAAKFSIAEEISGGALSLKIFLVMLKNSVENGG